MEGEQLFEVMLSSTFRDLEPLRKQAIDSLIKYRCFPVVMESDASRSDKDMIDASLAKVDASDGYICIVGKRYGQTPRCAKRNPNNLSLTELEFDRARTHGRPISVIEISQDYPTPNSHIAFNRNDQKYLDRFLEKIRANHRIIKVVRNSDEYNTALPMVIGDLRRSMEKAPFGKKGLGQLHWEAVSADPGGSDSGYNNNFYDLLKRTLADSRQLALIAGEGFDLSTDSPNRRIADDYLRVMANCASRHVVYRIEYSHSPENKEWIKALATLMPFYDGDRGMRVYRPKSSFHLIKNMAIVDPKSQSDKEAMLIMFPMQQVLPHSGRVISRAQAAVATRDKSAVQAAWSAIEQLLKTRQLFRVYDDPIALLSSCDMPSDFLLSSNDSPCQLYFAYGSNMHRRRIQSRAPSARLLGAARLTGYRLIFGRPPVTTLGGVASIAQARSRTIEGALFEMNEFDLDTRIAFFEGVREGVYKKVKVKINYQGRETEAWTFVFAHRLPETAPDEAYMRAIIDGAIETGVSESYIEVLRGIRVTN
jgi:gamma-glutamylcyclotransferase (GGCT)/AIG2-like uncharacterized protein YtfP